jgi:hypothetical protein
MNKISAFSLSFLLLFFAGNLAAQTIVKEQIFPVAGYSIFQTGYPIGVIPGADGQFLFLEYWAEGIEGHRISNYYLQSYGIRNYAEDWFKPVTNEGFDPMNEIIDIIGLDKGTFVVGYQYSPVDKNVHTVGRFFQYDGTPAADEPVRISNFDKKAKGFADVFSVSPNEKCMLWMGDNGREQFLTAWDGSGKQMWEKKLELPHVKDKYIVKDIGVDDTGFPYFLMLFSKPNFSLKDSLNPPIVVRMDPRTDEFLSDTLRFDSAYVQLANMKLFSNTSLVVTGALGDGSVTGILNGEKIDKNARNWSHFFYKRFKLGEEENALQLDVESTSPVPEKWIEKYGKTGSNFSMSEIILSKDKVILLLEEHYSNGEMVYFYDIGCIAFEVQAGKMSWSAIVEKRQRDKGSGTFLSYVAGMARGSLQLVYLSERGAAGELKCSSLDLKTGAKTDKKLASNEEAQYLFFPRSSGMIGGSMLLIGMGDPGQNDYKLLTVGF